MNWLSRIDNIVCINLLKRTDRLIDFTEMAELYEIPFSRVSAIADMESGAKGLRDTMRNLFNEEIEKGTRHLLVFEDDAEIIVPKEIFHNYMDAVILRQLPENYHTLFLGCQLSPKKNQSVSANLVRIAEAYSTHAVLYSLQGMKEIVSQKFDYPIDNWYVTHIQVLGHSYCTNPILVSQRDGYSDIGREKISWKPFLEHIFDKRLNGSL